MLQLLQAKEVAKIAEQGKEIFRKDALESLEFIRIIQEIEENALKGRTGFSKLLKTEEEIRLYEVFVSALIEAGYSSSIKSNTVNRFFHDTPMTDYVFKVSWKESEEL